jgi:sulfite exporter TauE/SafE
MLAYESLLLATFACLEVWPLGHVGPVLLSIVAHGLLCNSLCAGFFSSLSLSLSAMPMMISSWKSNFLRAGFRTGFHRRCRVVKEIFYLHGEVNTLMTSR